MNKVLIALLLCQVITAQKEKLGIILDARTKTPIEFVDVFNSYDNTSTNEDGKYLFTSTNDTINFYKLGYEKVQTTFSALKDTLFLIEKAFELPEVTVFNFSLLFDRVRNAIPKNYPISSYNEKFFIRSLLRYNDEITRIQDLQGKLRRKTLLYHNGQEPKKRDYVFEVENMRKIGLTDVEEFGTDIYFESRSLHDILLESVSLGIREAAFDIDEKYFDNQEKVRIDFRSNEENGASQTFGHYIIDTNDYAILEFYLQAAPHLDYNEKKNIKYRTTFLEKNMIFHKDTINGKYLLKNAKIKTKLEIVDFENTQKAFFESEDILKSYDYFKDFEVEKNVNANKDVFKLSFPYNAIFWGNQQQLLLTDEMWAFITSIDVAGGEFTISNMN